MAKEKGQTYALYREATPGTWQKVGALRQKSFTRARDLLEAMTDDDPNDAVYVPAARNGTLTINGLYDYSNAVQEKLQDDFESDTAVRYRLSPVGEIGADRFTFYGWVESVEIAANTNELTTLNVTIRTEGAVTRDVVQT
jgi:hypothetical protein